MPSLLDEKEVFAVNDDLDIQVHKVGKSKILCIDNFYKNPDKVRELAQTIPSTRYPLLCGGMPGSRIKVEYDLSILAPVFIDLLRENYRSKVRRVSNYTIENAVEKLEFVVNVTQSKDLDTCSGKVPHVDAELDLLFASTVYLNTPEECAGGTSFYTLLGQQEVGVGDISRWFSIEDSPLELEYITDTVDGWEMIHLEEMKYNRFILYPANILHSGYIKPGMFTGDVYRLVQMMFLLI